MAFERKRNPIDHFQRTENTPSREQTNLARRQRQSRDLLNAIVVKNETMEHVAIVAAAFRRQPDRQARRPVDAPASTGWK